MNENLTPEQRRAVVTHDRNLLVSAAAGSGKTEVLAERCAFLVTEAEPPCNADELLVVTFTVASAEEMRRRIGAKLSTKTLTATDPRLLRQPMLLAGAQIGTIHSLCSAVLRRHLHDVGLDPNFRVLDNDEAALLRRDVADRLVERKLEGEHADVTVRLLERYAGGSPARIVNTLLALHARVSALCDPGRWLAERRQRVAEASTLPIGQSELGRAAVRIMVDDLATLTANADRLSRLYTEAGFPPYVQAARQLAQTLTEWQTALIGRPFDQAADIIRSTDLGRLPPVKAGTLDERQKAQMASLKKRVGDFAKSGLVLFTEPQLQADVGRTLWAIDTLDRLVADFDEAYTAAKRDTNAVDFADLERYALNLLRGPDSQPTPVALEYRRHFKHVLVDEYQDVNELQDTLIAMLADESKGNLFCVGDVKQSIYRFRQADPARFKARAERYGPAGARDGELMFMRKNFRSRGPLLDVLNDVFEALMTEQSAEVDYDESQRLVAGATFPDDPTGLPGKPIELHVIEKKPAGALSDLEADEREAVLTAHRINVMLGRTGEPPARIAERGGKVTRPVEPGDFAILLRAVKIKSERFASILRRADLPVLADSTTGFFESQEVRDLLCALRLIDNSRNEYDLAGHLRSPLCQWPNPEDKLATIRLAYPTGVTPWFHRAAARYAGEKDDAIAIDLRNFFNRIDRWRSVAAEQAVANAVWRVLEETSYLAWCAGLPDGEQRIANLMELHDRARAFDRFRRPTLSRFLHFLGTLEDQADLGMPSPGSKEKAIRVMSIHKSKGLEYPVVVLPDLGKEFNLRDAGEMLLVDDTVGIGLRVVDIEREAHYPSLASTVAQHHIRRRSLAEELRVLYVGATRTREHLILIGTDEPGLEQAWDDTWRGHRGAMPAGDVLAARSMLDWVGPAAAQAESRHPGSVRRTLHTADDLDKLAKDTLENARRDDRVSLVADLQPLPDPPQRPREVRHAIKRLEWTYPHDALTGVPAVESVSSLTKRGQAAPGGESSSRGNVVAFDDVLRPPRCCRPDRTLTPTDRGSLTHTILQRLDFTKAGTPEEVRQQVGRLVEQRFIRADEADQADFDAVAWFASTALGHRCRIADERLMREFEIVFSTPADGSTDPADLVMVRGRIDAVIVDDDGLVVLDYKTDRVTADTVAARAAFYGPQIETYRRELQRVTGRPVKEAFLIFTAVRQVVPA